jgi:hypothetical protein
MAGLFIFAALIVTSLLMIPLLSYLRSGTREFAPEPSTAADRARGREALARPAPPPLPLDVEAGEQLRALRGEERALLEGYGWIDQEARIVRIPIARAMELVVERGLPVPAPAPGPAPAPEEAPK